MSLPFGTGLPYAAPLRAIDELRTTERDGGLVVDATKQIVADDPYLAAHFPGRTVYPGVFIVEGVRQAVAAALGEREGRRPEITKVRSLRFLGALHPGELMHLTATITPIDDDAVTVDAQCRRGDESTVARMACELAYPGLTGPDGERVAPSVCADLDPSHTDPRQPSDGPPARDFGEIRAVLPQDAPMVLLDRVDWLAPGQALRATKVVSGSEPCYAGVPAGLPRHCYAYPTSMVLESFGQAAAVLWNSQDGVRADAANVLMFAAARDCRFTGWAYPGDQVRHEVRLDNTVANTGFATGETWIAGRRIAALGWFVAVVRPASTVRGLAAPQPVPA